MITVREVPSNPVLKAGEWCRSGAVVAVACPICATVADISAHTILPDGTVEPSVACAREGCGFDDRVHLLRRLP